MSFGEGILCYSIDNMVESLQNRQHVPKLSVYNKHLIWNEKQ